MSRLVGRDLAESAAAALAEAVKRLQQFALLREVAEPALRRFSAHRR
ncbi:MAG: hypothetical protein LC776_02180 [Acidobacteria bacterium]|nr:hypothetical protein [Acidobacteriota bacterium]